MDDIIGMLAAMGATPAAARPAPPAASWHIPVTTGRHWEWCDECETPTEESATSPEEAICPRCGQIMARPTDTDTAVMSGDGSTPTVRPAPALSIAGSQAARYQKVLDRVSVTDPDQTASAEIYRELLRYNHEYAGAKFSEAILRDVAEVYASDVRTAGVSRSQYKQAILAKLIHQLSLQNNSPRSALECATLLQLNNKGLAHGESRMRELGVCIDILDADRVHPWVVDTFRRIGLQAEQLTPPSQELSPSISRATAADQPVIDMLHRAAGDMLAAGESRYVGVNQQPRTRAICSVYTVVRRAAMAGLLPGAWDISSAPAVPPGQRGSVEWIGEKCEIRPQTMKLYLQVLRDYHSAFSPIYARHGLAAHIM